MYFFSLECNEMSSNELWDIYGFGVTLGSLYIGAQGCVPVLLENLLGISLGQENPLKEDMATHFSILDWRIPWTEEPGRL